MGKWLTPNSSDFSNPLDCRKIELPGDLWLYIQGALELLTWKHNWEHYGTATPDETSQYFMDILDNFSVSRCGGMEFIDQVTFQLFSETYVMTSGYKIPIDENIIHDDAIGSSALLVDFRVVVPSTGYAIYIVDKDGLAERYVRLPVSGVNRLDVIIPMTRGGSYVSITAANGDTITWSANLVGWWP